jgi:uncharacterized protein (TIGR03067 family)
MKRFALLIVAAGLLVVTAHAKDDDNAKELKKLEGTWTLASGEDDGKKLSDDAIKNSKLTIEGEKHTVKVGDNTYKGTHKVDATKKPKTMDITDTDGPFKDKTVLAIYEVDGDTFKICYAAPGKDRPKEFSAKEGTGYHSHVWKREKK